VFHKVALGTVFHPVLQVSLIVIIPPMLHNHLRLNNVLIRRTSGQGLRTLKQKQGCCIYQRALYRFRIVILRLQPLRTVRPIYRTGVPLPSKCCILYIFSTNISTEYFKHAAHSPFFLFKMPFIS